MIFLPFNSALSFRAFMRTKAYYVRGLEANDWITCLSWLLLIEKDDLERKASSNFFWFFCWTVDKRVMEIKGNEREYFISEIMRTSRTAAAEISVGSCWISSIMSTAFSPACRNVVEIVQLPLSPFSAWQWRNEMHLLALWPTAIRYRPESFSSSQTRGTQKVRRAMRLSGRKAWYFV